MACVGPANRAVMSGYVAGDATAHVCTKLKIEIDYFFSNALQNVLNFLLSSGNRGSETAAVDNGGLGVPDRRFIR